MTAGQSGCCAHPFQSTSHPATHDAHQACGDCTGYAPLAQRYPQLAAELAALAAQAQPTDLLSLALPADTAPLAYIAAPDCVAWHRPDDAWVALGSALRVESQGPGRFAAIGAAWQGLAARWRHRRLDEHGPRPLAHIGFAFHDTPAAGPLPAARLELPSLLLRRQGGRQTLILSCPAGSAAQALAQWEAHWQSLWQTPSPNSVSRVDRTPTPLAEQAFVARTRAALAAIAGGQLDKVVLSRRVRLKANAPWHGPSVFATLAQAQPGSTVFAVGHDQGCFVGATPERLLGLHQGVLETEALAGTSWGAAEAPLESNKNHREHGWVIEAIRRTLAPLCAELTVASPQVLHLPGPRGLSHLRTPFRGRVAEGVGLFDLAARLHPTPAVGGWPSTAARDWLQAHGEDRPLWYSGGLGWIDPQGNGTLAVPLRCANLTGQEAELHAGAGIVAGSDPEQELAETEAKLAPMLDALGAVTEGRVRKRRGG